MESTSLLERYINMEIIVVKCPENTQELFLHPPREKNQAAEILEHILGSESVRANAGQLEEITIILDGDNPDLCELEYALKQCGWCKKK